MKYADATLKGEFSSFLPSNHSEILELAQLISWS